MIVVNACVWVASLTGGLSPEMEDFLDESSPVSPAHVDVEVGSALTRLERRGTLNASTPARLLLEEFLAIPFARIYEAADLGAALDFINNAHYADAVYLAMAKRLNCPVMSVDSGVIDAGRIGRIEVVDARERGETG